MTLLILSQIILNFTISLAAIIIGVFFGVTAYYTLKSIQRIKKFFDDISRESKELHEKLNHFLESFSALPLIAGFLRRRKSNRK